VRQQLLDIFEEMGRRARAWFHHYLAPEASAEPVPPAEVWTAPPR